MGTPKYFKDEDFKKKATPMEPVLFVWFPNPSLGTLSRKSQVPSTQHPDSTCEMVIYPFRSVIAHHPAIHE